MSFYSQLCGVTAACFAGHFPLLKVNASTHPAIQSLGRVTNAALTYYVISRVAEIVKTSFERVTRIAIQQQHHQLIFFAATVGFLFVLPTIEKSLEKFGFKLG